MNVWVMRVYMRKRKNSTNACDEIDVLLVEIHQTKCSFLHAILCVFFPYFFPSFQSNNRIVRKVGKMLCLRNTLLTSAQKKQKNQTYMYFILNDISYKINMIRLNELFIGLQKRRFFSCQSSHEKESETRKKNQICVYSHIQLIRQKIN